jgi:anti-anti-sigma regulatory factor
MDQNRAPVLSWTVEAQGDGALVRFHGVIDEDATFAELILCLKGAVVFDLEDVQRINSCGVREWVRFLRDIPQVTELVFDRCSQPMVRQMNMINMFKGQANVRSLYAPYHCETCDLDLERLLDMKACFPTGAIDPVPEFRCEKCGEPLEFDDVAERYFYFING